MLTNANSKNYNEQIVYMIFKLSVRAVILVLVPVKFIK